MKVHLITVGDEILIGQVVDTNSGWIGRLLNLHGARVERVVSVGDQHEQIINALSEALSRADMVLMTGGLGPTKDDITKKALADYFGMEMVFNEPTYERIKRIFEQLGRPTSEAHRHQCYMPTGATLLHNKMGTAPGMWFDYDGKVVVSMPGVPYEMEYIMEHQVIPRLKEYFPGKPIGHRTILTAGEGESRVAERLDAFENTLPEGMKLAYLPNLGQVRLRLTYSTDSQTQLDAALDEKARELESLLPDIAFGRGDRQLEEVLGQILEERGLFIGTAESCTGGYIAHRITAIPGASAYFGGSVVAYSNEMKMKALGVQPETLQQHGAVSEATVREMVQGALAAMPVDVVIAISGIAGPDGGTPEKPVGTIWMAVGSSRGVQAHLLRAGKDRLKNIQYAGTLALEFTRRFILEFH
ncbi:MAG: CinA family nicotinamide mononucleotide deamidase-related protein [Saprospiraceae bacterium]|nr:CinA family nicotinamide mononucleotide deamidase-related protein [Saprospiraceae bacterium]